MGAYKYSQPQKVAILMLALGDEIAAELLSKMDRREAQRVGRALASLGRIEQTTVDQIMAEFLDQSQTKPLLQGGSDKIKGILARALQSGDAHALSSDLGLNLQVGLPALEEFDAERLSKYLSHEHPQTIAIVMAHLEREKFRDTLKLMPPHFHAEVLMRVARLDSVDPAFLEELNQALQEEIHKHGPSGIGQRVGGPEKAAQLLNALDEDTGRHLLDKLYERSPELSEQIREKMFTYESIALVTDEGIRLLLQRIPRQDLMLALKLTSDNLQSKFFRNMSKRAVETLQDDLDAMPKVPKTDVEQAQSRIAALALDLKESGEMTLEGDEEYV